MTKPLNDIHTFFARNRLAVIAVCGAVGAALGYQGAAAGKNFLAALPVHSAASILTASDANRPKSSLADTKRIAAIFSTSTPASDLAEMSDSQSAKIFSVRAPLVPEVAAKELASVQAVAPPEVTLKTVAGLMVIQASSPYGVTINDQFVLPGHELTFLPAINKDGKRRHVVLEKVEKSGVVVLLDPVGNTRMRMGSEQ